MSVLHSSISIRLKHDSVQTLMDYLCKYLDHLAYNNTIRKKNLKTKNLPNNQKIERKCDNNVQNGKKLQYIF